jgi:formylmethanofuran dehydrogenase subunit E
MPDLQILLSEAAARHSHLCPRQVLGVRMGLFGAELLGLEIPISGKQLLVIAESDGCFVDGLEVATGATPGHRTLRIEDYGKIAATFVNTGTGQALRLAPRLDVRERAQEYASAEKRHYFAQLAGYQGMPADVLFMARPVMLTPSIDTIISRAGVRTSCCVCGEEIINEREIIRDGLLYCRSCCGQGYYQDENGEVNVPVRYSPITCTT